MNDPQSSEPESAVRANIDPDHPVASRHPAAASRVEEPAPPLEGEPSPEAMELRAVKRLLWGLLIFAMLAGLYAAQVVMVPLMAALLLSFLFKPVVRRFEGWGVAPPVSAMVILLLLCGALLLGGSAVGSSLSSWLQSAPASIAELEQKLESFRRPMQRVSQATDEIEEMANAGGAGAINEPVEVTVKESPIQATALSLTTTVAAGVVITAVMVFFFLAAGDLLLRQLVQALPSLGDKKEAVEAFYDLESHVSIYLITVTLINTGLAGIVWLALWLLGLPYAMWWGITAGVANFIPYVGPLVTAVLIFAASLLAYDTVGQALFPPLVFVTITTLEGYFVTPTILGRRLSLNPLIVFVWLIFWGWLWGVAGALLAVPMLICFKIVCDHIDALESLSNLLSGYVRRAGENQQPEPTPAPRSQPQTQS